MEGVNLCLKPSQPSRQDKLLALYVSEIQGYMKLRMLIRYTCIISAFVSKFLE